MSDETDTRDRVIRMEVELDQVKKDIQKVSGEVSEVKETVGEIRDILTQAKGVQKTIQILIWLSGTTIFITLATYSKTILLLLQGK